LRSGLSAWKRLNIRSSAKYLDLAEMLPKFNGGRIRLLQDIRSNQRTKAQEAFEKTRPMEGVSLQFDKLLLLEVFPIEDYDDLERQLLRLFQGSRRLEEILGEFSGNAGDLFRIGWSNIGQITREQVNSPILPLAAFSELPEEVHYINVSVSKILPSLFAVSFSIDLTQAATKKLQSLLNKRYLPLITFQGVLPQERNLRNRSILSSEQVMRKEVLSSLDALRLKVEQQLSKRFKGLFLRFPEGRKPRLPALEMLSIKGSPPDSIDIGERLRCNAEWMDCFGIAAWRTHNFFTDSEMLFQWSNGDSSGDNPSYKLVSFEDNDEPPKNQENKYFVREDVANSITPLIAVFGLIESTRREVETLRVGVYKTITRKSLFRRLRREIRLNDDMQLKQMILLRLQFELNNSRWVVESEAGRLKGFVGLDPKQQKDLGSAFLKAIDSHLEGVCGHSEVVSNVLSGYLQRRNLDVTYRLQRRLLYWTFIVSLVTVFVSLLTSYAIVKDWPTYKHLADWLRLHLHS
jgi:hypothetical protein